MERPEESARRAAVRALVVRGVPDAPPIAGVRLRRLATHRDGRGTLTELLREDWPDLFGAGLPFAQAYASVTLPGVARDEGLWHLHRRQTDRFVCLAGRIVVPIADARAGSPTFGRLVLVDLAAAGDAPAPLAVAIPPGALHGLVALGPGPAALLNFPTRRYDPGDEERVPIAGSGVAFAPGHPFSYAAVRDALSDEDPAWGD